MILWCDVCVCARALMCCAVTRLKVACETFATGIGCSSCIHNYMHIACIQNVCVMYEMHKRAHFPMRLLRYRETDSHIMKTVLYELKLVSKQLIEDVWAIISCDNSSRSNECNSSDMACNFDQYILHTHCKRKIGKDDGNHWINWLLAWNWIICSRVCFVFANCVSFVHFTPVSLSKRQFPLKCGWNPTAHRRITLVFPLYLYSIKFHKQY